MNSKSSFAMSNNTASKILAYMQLGVQYSRADIMEVDLTVFDWNIGIREQKEQYLFVQAGQKRKPRYSLSDRKR